MAAGLLAAGGGRRGRAWGPAASRARPGSLRGAASSSGAGAAQRRPSLLTTLRPAPPAPPPAPPGVNNELAIRHVPEVLPRNDTLAGPLGRRGDMVGGFFFLHRDDLKALSHGWLKYTEDVRADPEAWHLSGDSYSTHPGDKPWISEMYGYAFGASTADVWHKWDQTSMLYPGYTPNGAPGPAAPACRAALQRLLPAAGPGCARPCPPRPPDAPAPVPCAPPRPCRPQSRRACCTTASTGTSRRATASGPSTSTGTMASTCSSARPGPTTRTASPTLASSRCRRTRTTSSRA